MGTDWGRMRKLNSVEEESEKPVFLVSLSSLILYKLMNSCLGSVVDEDSDDDNNGIKRMRASNPFVQKMCCWNYISEVISHMGRLSNMGSSISLRSEGKKKMHREVTYSNTSNKSAN